MVSQADQRKKYSTAYLAQSFLWFYCPSVYMHRSRISEKLPYKLFCNLLGNGSLARRNHFRLSRAFSNTSPESIDVAADIWSFVTMSNYHLDYVIRIVAALEVGMRIRTTISGAQIKHLRKVFGEDVVNFVFRRHAGFYKGGSGWQNVDFEEINERLASKLGWAFLHLAGSTLPPNMLGVWTMRLPTSVDIKQVDSNPTPEEAFKLCVAIFKEVSNL
ncbi:SctK family type III secretion system sorting platform protein [Candidatus Ichthyocystis sparus]|uniref:SctK family type III secretion system sorting platform protein n=1 Tax=Candidatus Ichthyocystis sparus TaxID=1561004 RepID=UPI000B854E8A|nr:SctK family type III secretion system sorting platform protein [Candidatus Ichthyocystis sparus]